MTIKHLHEGHPGCVFVSRIDEHSPLKNHKVIELGSQLTHVNGIPISSSAEVSTLVQAITSSPNQDKDDKIVWSFSSAKLEEARERIRNGGAEQVSGGVAQGGRRGRWRETGSSSNPRESQTAHRTKSSS